MATKSKSGNWQDMLEDWFMKLPPLPKGAKEVLVNITPWIALIFGILGVLAGLAGLGILTAFSPLIGLSSGLAGATNGLIGAVLGIVSSGLLLAGYPGTKNHKLQGWNMLFWSEIVSTLAALVAFALGGVVISLVGLYLLYQIKSYYK